ncbi:hypothetical protein POTOM_021047 [Populus tomentosa]|uniref:RNA polymerase I specific transcription initiation factor RRN3 protein n=1 Tax=Populus tomentosa TaxID=118781 RepID=A0A8X7ZR83_POPTO|nr:hypothetical protein POTOM_021047 [Populus tomentosa]
MGVELTHQYTEYRAMEDQEEVGEGVSITDWDLVYHVRDALLSVKTGYGGFYGGFGIHTVLHLLDSQPRRGAHRLKELGFVNSPVPFQSSKLFGFGFDSDLTQNQPVNTSKGQKGDRSSYHQLVGVLHHRDRSAPDKVALLLTSLKALSGAVSYINDDDHVSLLQSIFGMSMWNCVPDVMDALLELIICLAASNGKYVDLCLDMLVNNFMPPMESDMLRHPRGQAKKDQVLPRVHTGLEVIVDLVPLAALKLSTTVVQKRPMFFRKDFNMDRLKCRMEIYLKNMLMLEGGAIREFVGNSMLVEVVNMMLELDVAIGWDELLRDDPTCRRSPVISHLHIHAIDLHTCNSDVFYVELPSTLTLRNLGKNVTADLLDSLMIQFLEHLEACADKKRLSEVFETLLSSFMATILNTYKSKFSQVSPCSCFHAYVNGWGMLRLLRCSLDAWLFPRKSAVLIFFYFFLCLQFTIFYACALDPENCGVKFAQTLVDLFISTCSPPVTRMSAVAYLSSYLARGKFLSAAFIMNMLKRLVDWCLRYCEAQDSGMNPKAHQVFYSACQGIMYVLCFHMKSIMNVPTLKSQLLLMPIEPILKHKLGPLEVCLPSIVNEFLRQAKAAHLFTISKAFIFEDLLESDLSRDFGGLERLDMFFPFDPCLLKKCDRFEFYLLHDFSFKSL